MNAITLETLVSLLIQVIEVLILFFCIFLIIGLDWIRYALCRLNLWSYPISYYCIRATTGDEIYCTPERWIYRAFIQEGVSPSTGTYVLHRTEVLGYIPKYKDWRDAKRLVSDFADEYEAKDDGLFELAELAEQASRRAA